MEKILNYFFTSKKKRNGRSNSGRISVFHRGNGCSRKQLLVDYKRDIYGVPCKVINVFYDNRRKGNLGLVLYSVGVFSVISLPDIIKKGDYVFTNDRVVDHEKISSLGSVYLLADINKKEKISNIEKSHGSGFIFCRTSGTTAYKKSLIEEDCLVLVELKSGVESYFYYNCRCMRGVVGNVYRKFDYHYKAGQNKLLGNRPVVRGVAMNPVDHPHGGGEGKTSGGRCSVTPWGKLTKGKKTVVKKLKNKVYG